MAFNAKNLQYDKKEPAFLRKLKGEFSGLDGRHNVQIPRPKKDRLKTGDEEEDEPVIVDEQGERIGRAEFERMLGGDNEAQNGGAKDEVTITEAEAEDEGKKKAEAERQKVAGIGSSATSRKRKAGKIVGGDGANDRVEDGKTTIQKDTSDTIDKPTVAKRDSTAQKKKAKKIKLSFDDPDG